MLDYMGWFIIPTTPAREQLFINSVMSHAYDAVDVMNNNNFATASSISEYQEGIRT